MSTVAALAALGVAVAWLRRPARVADRAEWVQLTQFLDSVSQPALSPDGRMLTFIRGPDTFAASGQIYVKMLPDDEAVQLTRDYLHKMSPVFSPDGSQIAYTTIESGDKWNTWLVPVLMTACLCIDTIARSSMN